MADTVRYLMEAMLPELEDLEHRGYFTKEEIKHVVKKRMEFEYLLKRMAAVKNDFLRYVEYEMNLEELRVLRKEAMGLTGKRTLADFAIVRRIHFIFERATRKFRGDLRLWMRWLDYCKQSNSPRQTSKVLTKALKLHPTAAGLWSYAAAWEFEHNSNAAAARALMQRGLRMCKGSEQLWAEYLRLELLYVHRLRARRQVLGIADNSSTAPLARQGGAANGSDAQAAQAGTGAAAGAEGQAAKRAKLNGRQAKKLVHSSGGSGSDGVGGSDSDDPDAVHSIVLPDEDTGANAAQQPPLDSPTAIQAVLSGAVAKVVCKNAIAAIPDSIAFRQRLLDVLEPFEFPGVEGLHEEVHAGIAADFPGLEEAWDMRARRAGATALATSRQQTLRDAVALYEEAVGQLSTPKMFDLYTAFLMEELQQRMREAEAADAAEQKSAKTATDQLTGQLLAVYERAHAVGAASESVLLSWPRLALEAGRGALALAAAEQAVKAQPASGRLWQQRLAIHIQQMATQARPKSKKRKSSSKSSAKDATSQEQQARALEDVALRAVQAVASQDAPELWITALNAFAATKWPCSRLLDQLVSTLWGMAKGPVRGGLGEVAGLAVEMAAANEGMAAARTLCHRILKGPSPGGSFFQRVLALEQAEKDGGQAQQKRIKCLFEAAIDAHGPEDVDLWLQYAQYEQAQSHGSGPIYWRATKVLRHPEPFIAACRLACIS